MMGLTLMGAAGCAEADEAERAVVATDVSLGSETRILGGENDDDPIAASYVVALKVGTKGKFELCSGALVAPNIVLTARHCVAHGITTTVVCDENGNSTNGRHVSGTQPASNVAAYTGASPKFGQMPEAVGTAIVAPKSEFLCDSDIALVVLNRPIDGVAPAAVRLDTSVVPGETIRSVGYGQNDQAVPLGTRFRKAGVAVLAMGRGVSQSHTALGPHEFEVGRSICQGDSGGPAISEQTGAIVGVVSRGGDCQEDFGHIYTTTAGWAELFDEAFALAGAVPIRESVARSEHSAPRAEPSHAPVGLGPAPSGSCSTGRAAPHGGAAAALLLSCALVLRCRRRTTLR